LTRRSSTLVKIDDEFKLRRLLHRQISRFGAFEYLIHVNSRTPIEVIEVCSIGHETTLINKLLLNVNSRQPVFSRKLDDSLSFGEKEASCDRHDRVDLLLLAV